ncbi:MAG: phosphate ABC transporter, permease protein PstA [Thiotrichales bacterium 32-46-8]|nr:MAG: phosphate ABC transporter, permease protein PstA [Thiotrichales bacterium 32-46-8]OYY23531.1 MAG: phosphate ABC transporter, permease protein PstA [Thiotrichales bacterium 35-46-9]OYZ09428.1 MAG: phosphate ABC transporter, permease protein PstA [Thiotrichales bacterium 16-46-22]OZA19865.1 MAG: phosphate ABC transporter, permease protein PstA [Thiotrichales bacterium 17-46-47]OZA96951.1 MAG: phosphate ABC transporter, permease protein PstA [Thiotrichales bacterium 34-46-19]OZB86547.1 MA
MLRTWMREGNHWVWFNAMAVAISLLAVIGLISFIVFKGMGHFWPKDIHAYTVQDGQGGTVQLIGELHRRSDRVEGNIKEGVTHVPQLLVKVGNRDIFGADFKWVDEHAVIKDITAKDLIMVERYEWGNLYGRLKSVTLGDGMTVTGNQAWDTFQQLIERHTELHKQIVRIQKHEIGAINAGVEQLRLDRRRLELDNKLTEQAIAKLDEKRRQLDGEYQTLLTQMRQLEQTASALGKAQIEIMTGDVVTLPIDKIVESVMPNAMTLTEKFGHYFHRIWVFLSDDPREANTEGGIFPAIFGTVTMVFIMTVLVMPFGVVAAVYLREYAKDGWITRAVRISVNNLAGVPSIVYGVFGLGFFVYVLGHNIDQLFYQEALPAPTFGTPGLLWAALTLALLTLPVVIVSTEEGLARVPRAMREGSLALGATKIETLWNTVLPIASPAIMTGLILAIARAAGEVAPLMLVGVVKLAPSLPVDSIAPYIHLDRKIMHLGFHINDVGFQSPNVEAAQPLVYATAFLLVLIIIALNITAITIRNRLRERFKSVDN